MGWSVEGSKVQAAQVREAEWNIAGRIHAFILYEKQLDTLRPGRVQNGRPINLARAQHHAVFGGQIGSQESNLHALGALEYRL